MTVGTFRKYSKKDLGEKKIALISLAAPIIEQYEKAGYAMTLRQLHYQLVARVPHLYPNTQQSYNRLGTAISDGRMAGLVSWSAIEDRVRFLRGQPNWEDPLDALKHRREEYMIDRWLNQPNRPEVWVEKDALIGVLQPVCDEMCVNYFSCKGYNSQSELWRAGQRFAGYIQRGQRPIVFHLGDHDPSGVDMTRDNEERLAQFAGVPVQVVRLALNMDQIRKYNPPPSFVKETDARTDSYRAEYGIDECWEVDALTPDVLHEIVRRAIQQVRDEKLWDESLRKEAAHKDELDVIIEANGG